MFRKWFVLGIAVLILAATSNLGADEPAERSRPLVWWDPLNLFEPQPKRSRQYLPLPRVDEGDRKDGLVNRGVPQGSQTRPTDPRPEIASFRLTSGTFDFMPIDYSFDEIVDQQ